MKGTLALLLIAAGLYIVYEVISGGSQLLSGGTTPNGVHPNNPQYTFQLAPQKTASQVGIASFQDQRVPGGAIVPTSVPFIPPPIVGPGETPKDPTAVQPVGGNMVSVQSRLRRLWE